MENGKLTYLELEAKWRDLHRRKRDLQREIDRVYAEMKKILDEINNLPLDNSEDL
jgi:hypothetical protein